MFPEPTMPIFMGASSRALQRIRPYLGAATAAVRSPVR
jgi:hypothetical protein